MASKKEEFFIITDERVLSGPHPWTGKLIEQVRWYRDVVGFTGVRIVKVIVDEKAV